MEIVFYGLCIVIFVLFVLIVVGDVAAGKFSSTDGKLKKFIVDYHYKLERWQVDIYAENLEDARRKLTALQMNGQVVGEVGLEVKV